MTTQQLVENTRGDGDPDTSPPAGNTDVTYEGFIVKGKAQGDWVLRFADGHVWEGAYRMGRMHGKWEPSCACRTDTKLGSGDTRTASISAVGPDLGKLNFRCSSPVAGVFGSRETNERAGFPRVCGSPPDNPV